MGCYQIHPNLYGVSRARTTNLNWRCLLKCNMVTCHANKLIQCTKWTSACYSGTDMGEIQLSATVNITGLLLSLVPGAHKSQLTVLRPWVFEDTPVLCTWYNLASLQVAFQPLAHLMSRLRNSSFKKKLYLLCVTKLWKSFAQHFDQSVMPLWILF